MIAVTIRTYLGKIGGVFLWQLDPKPIVSFEELLMSHVVQQEALTRLLVEKEIFTKVELVEMVKVVGREMKIKKGWKNGI